jgi:hypothetical protein
MSSRPPNAAEIIRRERSNPIRFPPPHRFPYDEEILADRFAWSEFQRAQDETMSTQFEQGGWVYMDLRSGRLSIRRAPDNRQRPRDPLHSNRLPNGASIDIFSNPPIVGGSVLVAVFHCHFSAQGGASPGDPQRGFDDIDFPAQASMLVPYFIFGTGETYLVGGRPLRAGPFAEAAQYPLFPPQTIVEDMLMRRFRRATGRHHY